MINTKNIIENTTRNNSGQHNLVKARKTIVVSPAERHYVDPKYVQKKFFHAISNSAVPDLLNKNDRSVIGITSTGRGEGKTLTAANLAVSMALAYKRKTLLLDMSLNSPKVHRIFGARVNPGLMESIQTEHIFITKTRLQNLYVMPAGKNPNFSLGLGSIEPMRKMIAALKREFPLILLDMTPILPIEQFPAVCAGETDGLLVVVDSHKTKYESVERIFRHIGKKQVLGFIFNKSEA